MEEEIELIYSQHCQTVTSNNKTVNVRIYGTGKNDWVLEVVDENCTSTVWDDLFDSDDAAFQEFERTLAEEGIEAMIAA